MGIIACSWRSDVVLDSDDAPSRRSSLVLYQKYRYAITFTDVVAIATAAKRRNGLFDPLELDIDKFGRFSTVRAESFAEGWDQ